MAGEWAGLVLLLFRVACGWMRKTNTLKMTLGRLLRTLQTRGAWRCRPDEDGETERGRAHAPRLPAAAGL